jgi:hypothetical protein
MSFDVSYYPGIAPRAKDFEKILDDYRRIFTEEITAERTGLGGGASLLADDLYHFSLLWLLNGREEELYNGYIFDIRPATDARPYYTAYMKPKNLPVFMDQLREVTEEWGYLLLLGTLFISILAGILIILVPMFGRWKELFQGRRGTVGIIVYYASLGMGYMLVEIFLIQRLVFFLAEPIFSVSIVITTMLILSGLGSITSRRMRLSRANVLRIAALAIGVTMIFYMFGLTPLINALIGLPLVVKALLAVVIIAPAAFFMGMPFPTGLTALESHRSRLLPWALGMNGALSVTGSVATKLLSISFGFRLVLIIAVGLYGIVALIYPANERSG